MLQRLLKRNRLKIGNRGTLTGIVIYTFISVLQARSRLHHILLQMNYNHTTFPTNLFNLTVSEKNTRNLNQLFCI